MRNNRVKKRNISHSWKNSTLMHKTGSTATQKAGNAVQNTHTHTYTNWYVAEMIRLTEEKH